MRIFLDANVVFSASNQGSNVARLIEQVVQRHTPITSDFALEEARRNVLLKRAPWTAAFDALASQLDVTPSILFDLPIALAEKDQPILCTAIEAKCEILVTGDKTHFGQFYGDVVLGVQILSLSGLASAMRRAS